MPISYNQIRSPPLFVKSVLFYQITTIHAAFGTDKYVTLLIENLFFLRPLLQEGASIPFFRLSCPLLA